MVTTLTLSLLLSFTPDASKFQGVLLNAEAPHSTSLSLAVPGFKGVAMPADKAEFFSTHFATELSRQGLKVTTAADIQALLSLERQKQLTGCGGESGSDKCMTEVANALGADGIVIGSIANLDGTLAINLKVIDADDGRTLALFTANVPTEKAVLETLTLAAKDVADQVRKAHGAPAVSATGEVGAKQEIVQSGPPQKFRYEKREGSVTKWGGRLMIASGVLLGVSLTSFVVSLVIVDSASDLAGFLFLAAVGEALLVPPLFITGLVMALVGTDEVVQVRADLQPAVPELPQKMMVAFRF